MALWSVMRPCKAFFPGVFTPAALLSTRRSTRRSANTPPGLRKPFAPNDPAVPRGLYPLPCFLPTWLMALPCPLPTSVARPYLRTSLLFPHLPTHCSSLPTPKPEHRRWRPSSVQERQGSRRSALLRGNHQSPTWASSAAPCHGILSRTSQGTRPLFPPSRGDWGHRSAYLIDGSKDTMI